MPMAPFFLWERADHGRMSAARGPSVHLLPWSTARLLCSHRKGWFYARTGYGAPGRRCFYLEMGSDLWGRAGRDPDHHLTAPPWIAQDDPRCSRVAGRVLLARPVRRSP